MNVLESSLKNQKKKKKKKQKRRRRGRRESWRKKERMRARFTGMFLNEGEKEDKRRAGTEIGHVEEKNKKKRNETYG